MSQRISGTMLRDSLISAANLIAAHREQLNEINVFPVPDGDTGANMSVTMGAAKSALLVLEDGCPVEKAARRAASSMLRGSRGNSGAILALLFRGFARGLEGKEEAGAADLLAALKLGIQAAYQSVKRPTEGTILTVARESAAQGERLLKASPDATVAQLWSALLSAAGQSLENTPRRLPALAEAGVVDAGGQGFCLLLQGMAHTFSGQGIVPAPRDAGTRSSAYVFMEEAVTGAKAGRVPITYRLRFSVRREGGSEEELRAVLSSIGVNVVVVEAAGTARCQVYTSLPGQALRTGLEAGALITFTGEASSTPTKITFPDPTAAAGAKKLPVERGPDGKYPPSLPFTYCTEFTILKDAAERPLAPRLVELLEAAGDSAVIVEGDDLVKCHVHTNSPAEVLQAQLESGYIIDIKIENMREQMREAAL